MGVIPKVSIIIPIYNVERYIEKCTRSLLEQTLKEGIEFIFVNDCTSDKSMDLLNDVIKEYPERNRQIKIIDHRINKGIATVRNIGLENATGEYIGWVDSDDWIEKNMFETLYSAAKENDADMVWCDYYLNAQTESVISQNFPEQSQVLFDAITKGIVMGILWNKLIRRNLFVNYRIKFLDGMNMAEDLNVLVKILRVLSKIIYIPQPLYHYNRGRNDSMTDKVRDIMDPAIENRVIRRYLMINRIDAIKFVSRLNQGWITEEELIISKLLVKREYLFSSNVSDLRFWSIIFPETNLYIFRCSDIRKGSKIVGWLAAHHCWLLLRILLGLRNLKNKYINNIIDNT